MIRDEIVAEARTWIGTPWRHHGRNRAGIDCVGLGVVVASRLGITDYDSLDYGRKPVPGLVDHIRLVADEIPIDSAMPGDFFLIRDQGYPFHVAFVSEKHGVKHIIHAHARRRKVVEEPFAHEWPGLIMSAWRLKGVQ
ncbi:C40 family peptidase [Castellaniella sp.]|uniref:C40 family peptidase n=1 Tax=Castellaniella sp. TaxID=1955812 RepID=UPI003560E80A